ncbi:uncharacterized protein N7511_000882 [Penicillium nucicola]|uniref:uncharacterized protein n=1 Tax=Penicillium nucicola TaxID=1850975 RepID=UPI0025454044|nr:uncharacterized protein N7511_000882 [Penicillium nucicola]KAJ5775871.1 hypothetical protein N7511_000882 [Penicillium nucicola]
MTDRRATFKEVTRNLEQIRAQLGVVSTTVEKQKIIDTLLEKESTVNAMLDMLGTVLVTSSKSRILGNRFMDWAFVEITKEVEDMGFSPNSMFAVPFN